MTNSSLPAPRELRPYQLEAVAAVEDAWSSGEKRVGVVLPTGSGKPHPHSTPVPTPNGVKLHGDLRIGDVVFHQSGNPTAITHIHPQGVIDVWRITFSDKTSVLAGKNHLWKVWRRKRKPKLMTTWELANTPLVDASDNGTHTWRIPMTKPVKYPEQDLPIEPYTMGALIASGSISIYPNFPVTISTTDRDVWETVCEDYPNAEVNRRGKGATERCVSFSEHPEIAENVRLLKLDVLRKERFIPKMYLESSVSQRTELLHGIFDTAADISGRRSITLSMTSEPLAKDVQKLVCSLGGTAEIRSDDPVQTGDSLVNLFTVRALLPYSIPAFNSQTKLKTLVKKNMFEPHRSIVSVEYAGKEECQCITVDNPDGLYLVGNEHIVTHNSTVIASLAVRARNEGKKTLLLAHRGELLKQMADSVEAVDPGGEKVGIVAADQDDNHTAIVAASFQTLSSSPKRLFALGKRDLVLPDECFPAGTKLFDGRAIEDINAGDTVVAFSESEQRPVTRVVTEAMRSRPHRLLTVTLGGNRAITCTPGHPFLVQRGGKQEWIKAEHLKNQWVCVCDSSGDVSIAHCREVIEHNQTDDGTFGGRLPDGYVYNLEVDTDHTYLLAKGVIVHNCHHISAPTYLRSLDRLGVMDDTSDVMSCGFTATMYRDDGKALGDVWSKVVFERDMLWAIHNGFLIKPKGKTVALKDLNRLSQIKNVGGDYKQSELSEVMIASVDSTVDSILRHCPNAAMIVFAAGVEHAQLLAEKLTASGIPAKDVTGAHKRDYREEAYTDFREGRLNALVTVQVLTEGADFPRCDTVVLARPTRSKVLLCQIIGRAVRLYTDPVTGKSKSEAVVLDLTGVVRDMKMASLTDLYPEAEQQFFDSDGEDRTEDEEFMDELLGKPAQRERKGRIELEDIDLIDETFQSKAVWLRTHAVNQFGDEIAFMPLRQHGEYVFIYPPINRIGNDMAILGHLAKNGQVTFLMDPRGLAVRGTLAQAMDAAESMATPKGYIRRKDKWREPYVKPTDAQLNLGRNLAIPNVDQLSRAELSDRITMNFATRLFAGVIARYPI